MGTKRKCKLCHLPKELESDCTPRILAGIKALLGIVINVGIPCLILLANYIKHFSDVLPSDEFLVFFWNLHFAHAEGQHKLKLKI
jgi:hypothetical protein